MNRDTICVQGGYTPGNGEPRQIPIIQSTTFKYATSEDMGKLFDLEANGYFYSRLQNPTCDLVAKKICELEGGTAAMLTGSGQAANFMAVFNIAGCGDHIVASSAIYGGTYNQFRISLRNLGIDCRIAASERAEDFEALADERTKALYVESMGNPTCAVPDLEALAALARRIDVPFVVDNTFGAAGYLCNPFEWGADIVVDSATKWINGHGTSMGGVIVDGGTYDWGNGKFPQIDGPSEGYHGLNLREAFGAAAFIAKCRVDGLRDLGCCPSPFDSYLMMIGLETLSLRVKHQVESTWKLAEYCRSHPKVERVSFVGFDTHPSHENARKYYRYGSSAGFTVELKGTLESTVRFVESLRLAANMTMIGDSITVVTHPASTTHKQLSDADLAAAGVTPTLLRISLGLENADDLIEDFEQAFAQIG